MLALVRMDCRSTSSASVGLAWPTRQTNKESSSVFSTWGTLVGGEKNGSDICAKVIDAARIFSGSKEFDDDATAVCVSIAAQVV
jgi:hypothetical protein